MIGNLAVLKVVSPADALLPLGWRRFAVFAKDCQPCVYGYEATVPGTRHLRTMAAGLIDQLRDSVDSFDDVVKVKDVFRDPFLPPLAREAAA
jgi:hypothetical protein